MPAVQPTLRMVGVNEVDLAVWEWPGQDPPFLFLHATGFHGRCWDQIVRSFPERRSISIDLRGHGRSSKPAPPYRWLDFGSDVAAVAAMMGIEAAIGVGHSMGGHSLVAAVSEHSDICAALLLIDPTIFEPTMYGQPAGDPSFIERRRNVWNSPDEMFERFRHRRPFSVWQPDVLRDYCNYGLLPRDGEWVLACPPDIEAAIYRACTDTENNLYPRLGAITQPVTVMRAGTPWVAGVFDLNSSPATAALAAYFPNGRDLHLAEHSHYIPMESPDLVAVEIRAIADRVVGSGARVRI